MAADPRASTSHYTPPLLAKTLVAQTLKAAGIGDGDFRESFIEAVRDAQLGMRAVLHIAKIRPECPVSDPAIIAHIAAEIGRLAYALDLFGEEPVAEMPVEKAPMQGGLFGEYS